MHRVLNVAKIVGSARWSVFVILMLGCLFSRQAAATSVWYDCWGDKDQVKHFDSASVVVVATVEKVAIKGEPKDPPVRTVRWKVHESWKGQHYKGSDFSTADNYFGPKHGWDLREGRAMLLYLRGKEPYTLPVQQCGRTGYLEESIDALNELFRLRQKWEQGPAAIDWSTP